MSVCTPPPTLGKYSENPSPPAWGFALRKSLGRRGWISQYLPRFGGARIQSSLTVLWLRGVLTSLRGHVVVLCLPWRFIVFLSVFLRSWVLQVFQPIDGINSNALKCIFHKGLSFTKLSFTTLTVYMQIFVVSKVLQGSFLLLYISHIGCICLTFLQCAFSNVLSKYLW